MPRTCRSTVLALTLVTPWTARAEDPPAPVAATEQEPPTDPLAWIAGPAIVEEVEYVELSGRADFNDLFVDQLAFPV